MSDQTAAPTIRKFLVFSLNGEHYGIPLLSVREVIAPTNITPVPNTPSYFLGVMNLRGQVVSVMDLRQKLRLPKVPLSAESAIIILDFHPLSIGILVDKVDSVLAAQESQMGERPDIDAGTRSEHITAVYRDEAHNKLILIFDVEKTLNIEELKALKNQNSSRGAVA